MVLELAGSPFHTDAGLHPVRTLLERRCGIDRSTDQAERLRLLEAEVAARWLDPVTVVPLLAPVLGIGAEAGYEPVAAEGRKLYELIAQAVQTYLLACVGGGAGLVVAEDVHWFDPSTMRGARRAAGRGRGSAAGGDHRTARWLAADRLAGQGVRPGAVDRRANRRADHRAESGPDAPRIGRWWPAAATGCRSTSSRSWPDSVRPGCPRRCMSRCSPGCAPAPNVVPVVEAAAVIGRQMDRGLLCSVVDLSDDEVDDVIDELEDALVLEPWGTDGWRFRHELLREVAAELAPPSVRRGLHAKVADALIGGGEPGLAAGRRPLRAGRAVRRGGLGLPAGVERCAPPRRAGRGAHLPDPGARAAGPRHTRPGPRPPRDGAAVGAGIPRLGRRGLSKPRGRRGL